MRIRYRVCAIVLAISAPACSPKEDAAAPASEAVPTPTAPAPGGTAALESTDLGGKVWLIDEIAGEKVVTPADARQPFVEFNAAETFVNGFAGCNTFRGGYESDGASLKFGALASTRMSCGPDRDKVEMTLHQALGNVTGFAIAGTTLTLSNAEGAVLIRATTHTP